MFSTVYYMSRVLLCSKCLLGKPEEEFDKDTKRKSLSCCKECRVIKDGRIKSTLCQNGKEYYMNNKDKILEKKKIYHSNNKESISEKKKDYYQNNIDRMKERSKLYYEQKVKQISKLNTPTNQT